MNDRSHPSIDSPNTAKTSIVAPVLIWVLVQMVPLALSAVRIPLWARGAQPAEQFALPVMLLAQVWAASLLFPWLMRDGRSSAFVIALAGPFVCLAGALTAAEGDQIAIALGMSLGWMVALWLWARVLRTPFGRVFGAAIAGNLTLGGAFAAYSYVEFSQGSFSRIALATGLVLLIFLAAAISMQVICRKPKNP